MITLDEAQIYLRRGAVLIDVRERDEFLSGHLNGAINIPLMNILSGVSSYSKDKCIIVYCQMGRRSAIAVQTLRGIGYSNVYDLDVKL